MAFREHHVPMCRQRIDPREWADQDGCELGETSEWSGWACGMAALRMILLAHRSPAPSLTGLLKLGFAQGELTKQGWRHAGIARLATALGVAGHAEAASAEELPARLEGGPLIASVTSRFPDDGRRGGHLVVLRGYELDQADPLILFRDPSGWGQQHDRVTLSRLASSYTGRCITFTPLSAASSRGTASARPQASHTLTSDCPIDCLRAELSAMAFDRLARAHDAPFDPPVTVGDVIRLARQQRLRNV